MNTVAYADDSVVRTFTESVMRYATVFQLFQLEESEHAHSLRLLELIKLPIGAKVLSLGCGVGGMEAYWQAARPDLDLTLVNISPAQLDLCLANGRRVLIDAQEYRGEACDVVVAAYMLGHVDPVRLVRIAAEHVRPGGVLLVADVFDSTPAFDYALQYDSPSRKEIERTISASGLEAMHILTDLQAPDHVKGVVPSYLMELTHPAIMIYQRTA